MSVAEVIRAAHDALRAAKWYRAEGCPANAASWLDMASVWRQHAMFMLAAGVDVLPPA